MEKWLTYASVFIFSSLFAMPATRYWFGAGICHQNRSKISLCQCNIKPPMMHSTVNSAQKNESATQLDLPQHLMTTSEHTFGMGLVGYWCVNPLFCCYVADVILPAQRSGRHVLALCSANDILGPSCLPTWLWLLSVSPGWTAASAAASRKNVPLSKAGEGEERDKYLCRTFAPRHRCFTNPKRNAVRTVLQLFTAVWTQSENTMMYIDVKCSSVCIIQGFFCFF